MTAGTEHNTPDLIGMEPACLNGKPVPEKMMAIFREGACVIAAHQQLHLNGQPGFTAACGEERIQHLAKIGAAAVARCAANAGVRV